MSGLDEGSSDVSALLEALEQRQAALGEAPTPEAVDAYVEARAPLLASLEACPVEGAPSERRRGWASRLAAVLERDHALEAALAQARDAVRAELERMRGARHATEGYRADRGGPRILNRKA